MQISKAVMSDVAVSAASLIAVLAAGIVLHLVFLVFNITATKALQLGKTENSSGMNTPPPNACIQLSTFIATSYGTFLLCQLCGLSPQLERSRASRCYCSCRP